MAYSSYLLPNFGGGFNTGGPPLIGRGGGYDTGGTTYPAGGGGAPMMPMSAGSPTSFPGGNVSANSKGTGFGSIGPDLSGVPISQQQQLMDNLGRLTYNLEGGGYRFKDANYKGNLGAWHGSDANANQLASQTYGFLGSLPTRNYGTLALERLYQSTGQQPSQGPSMTSRLGQPWQGPWAFPGYDPLKQYR